MLSRSLFRFQQQSSSPNFSAPFVSHMKDKIVKDSSHIISNPSSTSIEKLTFAKFGAVLILSKTNTFRTLVAEAFIRGAIEKRMNMIEKENTKLSSSKNEEENENDEKKMNENLEVEGDMMFSNPEKFKAILEQSHKQNAERVASSTLVAHPNLRSVVSAGRAHIPAKDGHQLHPVAKKLLIREFADKVPSKIVEGDDEVLWRKGMSSVIHSINSFDVIISIVDGDKISAAGDNNGNGLLDQDIDDDDDQDEYSNTPHQKSSGNSSSANINTINDLSSNNYCDVLDADPFSRIPGMENLISKKANGNLATNAMPSHWKAGVDGSYARDRHIVFSPRNPEVASDSSPLRFQDDYEGEAMFNQVKPLHVKASVKKVRWFLPSTEDLSKKLAFETEDEYEKRVLKVMKKIERMVDELCCSNE